MGALTSLAVRLRGRGRRRRRYRVGGATWAAKLRDRFGVRCSIMFTRWPIHTIRAVLSELMLETPQQHCKSRRVASQQFSILPEKDAIFEILDR